MYRISDAQRGYYPIIHAYGMLCLIGSVSNTGPHFPDDIFKYIILNINVRTLITISLKFVPKGPINSIPASVQIMAIFWTYDG